MQRGRKERAREKGLTIFSVGESELTLCPWLRRRITAVLLHLDFVQSPVISAPSVNLLSLTPGRGEVRGELLGTRTFTEGSGEVRGEESRGKVCSFHSLLTVAGLSSDVPSSSFSSSSSATVSS